MSDPFDWTLTALEMKGPGVPSVTVPANKIDAFRARGYVANNEELPAPVADPAKDEAPGGCC